MDNCGKDILLEREGTEQQQRFIDALDPKSVKLNDFSLKEWLQFAYRFARRVNYFNTTDHENPVGNWKDFFIDDSNLEDFIKQADQGKDITPHLALFVSFVQLLELSKKRFNGLTQKHLDFYYRHILKIEKLPPTPDKVHLIFELAKKSTQAKLKKDTRLDAGKDANGTKRIYKTTSEYIANKASVSDLKSVYNDHVNSKIKAAKVANSYDGQGEDFPDSTVKWWPFGYYGDTDYPELADARLGFAIAGDILQMQEGQRNVLITVVFENSLNAISLATLTDSLEIYCSGEKGWLGPFSVKPAIVDDDGSTIYSSKVDISTNTLQLAFQVPKEEKAIVSYVQKTLAENFNTTTAVCRVLLKTGNVKGHALFRDLVEKRIKQLSVDIDVKGVKSLTLESDAGPLKSDKPFYPFGTQPVIDAHFQLDYPELFKKDWQRLDISFDWKDTPPVPLESSFLEENFPSWYFAYREDFYKNQLSTNSTSEIDYSEGADNMIVTNDSYFTAGLEILLKEEWKKVGSDITLFNQEGTQYTASFGMNNSGYTVGENGPVRLSLNQTFLHELYPKIYAIACNTEKLPDAEIPNEPYTPFAENPSLDYTATALLNKEVTQKAYRNNPITLFHEHPFGQTEEHPWLKDKMDFLSAAGKKLKLLPTYCKGGEFYVGLENAKVQQQVAILIQVLEGSENPQAASFTGKEKVLWYALCQNEWQELGYSNIISDDTDNFLKSGIVKIAIPREATTANTILPAGKLWLRAVMYKDYDVVCKFLAVEAQAVEAVFTDNKNELSHLKTGLEAETISKMVQRIPEVKRVSQPFSSFEGKPRETDSAYYRRISERLRHKNRAVTMWDYEHIVLQRFPDIHKVKCLNHTSKDAFLAPGNVLLVVIPDIVDKNVFDIYQPRVSQKMLNEVHTYISELNSLHVNVSVVNPEYEEVSVVMKAKFYRGYDENYYSTQLEKDITKLLSPWAFDETRSIDFGVTLHRSQVIYCVENLYYVDYVSDVKLLKGGVSMKSVIPSNPKAILVSAKKHTISTDTSHCTEITETEGTCQT